MADAFRTRAFAPTDADHEAVASLNAGAADEERLDFEPCSAAALRDLDAAIAGASCALGRRVTEDGAAGRVIAYAQWFQMPWLTARDAVWCTIRCDPGFRRRGAGGRLYGEALAAAAALAATTIRTEAPEGAPETLSRLARLGFTELFRSLEFQLDLRGIQPATAEAHRAPGLVITTLVEEQAKDPAWLEKLYALHAEVTRDVPLPGHPSPEPPIEWFRAYLTGWPASLPDACFIAKDGDRYVGLAILHRGMGRCLKHLLTGVDRAHRGRGIAKALKLRTIAYAVARGDERIWTAVESNNPAMLEINRRLGFVHYGGQVVLERAIRGRAQTTAVPSPGPGSSKSR